MAFVTTGTAGAAAALIRTHFDQKFLARLDREAIIADLLDQKVVPANSGKTVEFHRIQNLAFQTIGLSGTAAAGEAFGNAHAAINATAGQLKQTAFVVDSVQASLFPIGNDMEITELAILTMEPNPLPELTDVFMYNGVGSIEQKCMNLMVCSNANGSSSTSTPPSINYNGSSRSVVEIWGDGSATLTEATLDADNPTHRVAAESLNAATFRLRNAAVPVHPKIGAYACLMSPGQCADLRLDGTFQEIALKGTLRGEAKFERASIGNVFGCEVMESPYVSFAGLGGTIDATNDEIHRGIVFGSGYAAKVSHKTGVGKPRFSLIMPTPSPADPYGNVAFLVWKAYFAGVVLNPYAGVLLKSATTNKAFTISGDGGTWG